MVKNKRFPPKIRYMARISGLLFNIELEILSV